MDPKSAKGKTINPKKFLIPESYLQRIIDEEMTSPSPNSASSSLAKPNTSQTTTICPPSIAIKLPVITAQSSNPPEIHLDWKYQIGDVLRLLKTEQLLNIRLTLKARIQIGIFQILPTENCYVIYILNQPKKRFKKYSVTKEILEDLIQATVIDHTSVPKGLL